MLLFETCLEQINDGDDDDINSSSYQYTSTVIAVEFEANVSISLFSFSENVVFHAFRGWSSKSEWTRRKKMKSPKFQVITRLSSLNSGWMAEVWRFRKLDVVFRAVFSIILVYHTKNVNSTHSTANFKGTRKKGWTFRNYKPLHDSLARTAAEWQRFENSGKSPWETKAIRVFWSSTSCLEHLEWRAMHPCRVLSLDLDLNLWPWRF